MIIFLSYSSKNRELAARLVQDLEALGHTVWFDQKLTGGQAWWDKIIEQIIHCELFVFALSPEWLMSRACNLELDYAVSLKKQTLPIQIVEGLNLGLLPAKIQSIQLVNTSKRDAEGILRLVQALNSMPVPQPLPNPLPPAPALPISELAVLSDELRNQLTFEQQSVLLVKLRNFMLNADNTEDGNTARRLLMQLRKHADTRATIADEITELLGKSPRTAVPITLIDNSTDVIKPGVINTQNMRFLEVQRTLKHMGTVQCIRFDPKTGRLACGTSSTEAVPRQSSGFIEKTMDTVFSRKDYRFGGEIYIWKPSTGSQVCMLEGNSFGTYCLDYSPDGKILASGGEHSLQLWDAETCSTPGDGYYRFLRKYEDQFSAKAGQSVIRLSPAGKYIALVLHGSNVIEVATLREQKASQIEWTRLNGHGKRVNALAFSPDGKWLASGSDDTSVRIWGPYKEYWSSKDSILLDKHSASVHCVAFSNKGNYLASASADGTVRIWDLNKREEVASHSFHTQGATYVSFSPVAPLIVSTSKLGAIVLWDFVHNELYSIPNSHSQCATFSPDGKMIASYNYNMVDIWAIQS